MKLTTIFDQLTYGELSMMNIGGAETQGITIENRKNIVSHIDLGLTELHKRFLLKEGRFKVSLLDGQLTYVLNSRYAVSNTDSTEEVKYIEDGGSPFKDDILKVERIYDQDGKELALNDLHNELSIHTPSYNMLVVPDDKDFKATTLTVVYRADHPTLDKQKSGSFPEEVDVELPMSHLEPLLYYVASRVINPMGASVEFHEGNNYASKFEQSCKRIENLNYRIDTTPTNTKFERNGWV